MNALSFESATRYLRRRPAWHAPAAIVLLAIAAYANTLGHGFVLDDVRLVGENREIRSLWNIPSCFLHGYWPEADARDRLYRPLVAVSLTIDWKMGRGDAWPFHITNLLLHLLCALLVWRVTRAWWEELRRPPPADDDAVDSRPVESREMETTSKQSPSAIRFAPLPGSLLGFWSLPVVAAMLFAVHPVHTEAVNAIVNRSEMMLTLGVLLALWAGMEVERSAGGRRKLVLAAVAFASALALGSKETGIVLPLLWAAHDAARRGEVTWARLQKYGVFLGVLLLYLVGRFHALGTLAETRDVFGDTDLLTRIGTVTAAIGDYFRMLFWPFRQCADYPANTNANVWCHSAADLPFQLGAVAAVSAAVLGVWAWKAGAVMGVWWLWIPIGLLPVLHLVPIGAVQAERWCYLPSVGACVAAATMLVPGRSGHARNMLQRIAGIVLIGTGLAITVSRNPAWKDDMSFAEALCRDAPENPFGPHYRGAVLQEAGRHVEAVESFTIALAVRPSFADSRHRRAVSYAALGRYREAHEDLYAILARDPGDWKVRNNLAMMEVKIGEEMGDAGTEHFGNAVREYTHILEADGRDDPVVRHNRAHAWMRLKSWTDAIVDLHSYLQRFPDDWTAWHDLAGCEAWLGHGIEVARLLQEFERRGEPVTDAFRDVLDSRLRGER